jgi:hypothetical protein
MAVIVRKDDDLAGLDFDRRFIWNLRGEAAFDHIMVGHHVFGTVQQRAAILRRDLREDAPRCGELGVEKDSTLETNNPQQI